MIQGPLGAVDAPHTHLSANNDIMPHDDIHIKHGFNIVLHRQAQRYEQANKEAWTRLAELSDPTIKTIAAKISSPLANLFKEKFPTDETKESALKKKIKKYEFQLLQPVIQAVLDRIADGTLVNLESLKQYVNDKYVKYDNRFISVTGSANAVLDYIEDKLPKILEVAFNTLKQKGAKERGVKHVRQYNPKLAFQKQMQPDTLINDEQADEIRKNVKKMKNLRKKWNDFSIDAQKRLIDSIPETINDLGKKKMKQEVAKNLKKLNAYTDLKIGDWKIINNAEIKLNSAVSWIVDRYGDSWMEIVKAAYKRGNEIRKNTKCKLPTDDDDV